MNINFFGTIFYRDSKGEETALRIFFSEEKDRHKAVSEAKRRPFFSLYDLCLPLGLKPSPEEYPGGIAVVDLAGAAILMQCGDAMAREASRMTRFIDEVVVPAVDSAQIPDRDRADRK